MGAIRKLSSPQPGGGKPTLERLRQILHEEIGAYLKSQGRDHLRLDEMFGLTKPLHFHLAPDKQKMVRPYLPTLTDEGPAPIAHKEPQAGR